MPARPFCLHHHIADLEHTGQLCASLTMTHSLDAITHVNQLPGRWSDPSLLAPLHPEEALSVAQSIAPQVIAILAHPAASRDVLSELFHPDGFWRDLISLSWTFRSIHGVE